MTALNSTGKIRTSGAAVVTCLITSRSAHDANPPLATQTEGSTENCAVISAPCPPFWVTARKPGGFPIDPTDEHTILEP